MIVQIHQPFSIPKQWVVGPSRKFSFTERQDEASNYSEAVAKKIAAKLHKDYPNAVIQTAVTAFSEGRY